jgi:CHAT domain-containing protein/predicted negative regulator of RcsB-dependent stress response
MFACVCLWSTQNVVARVQTDGDVPAVRALLERGEYARAEAEALRLVARFDIREQSATPAGVAALDLLVEAAARNGKSGDANILELANRAVRVNERLAGRESLPTATSLHNLGAAHFERGEFGMALAAHQRALSIRVRHVAPGDPAIADSLERVALAEILLERAESARIRLDGARRIRDAHGPTAPLAQAGALELQALWHRYEGDLAAGLDLVDRVVAIRGATLPDRPYTTSLLELQGDLLFLKGDIVRAQQVWSEGLALSERTLDSAHPTISLFLRKLAYAADAFGNRADSRKLLDRAVQIGKGGFPPCHPEVPALLNDSAVSAQRDGDFAVARGLYRQQLRVLQKCGANANWTATALHNLGNVSFEMGEVEEAERLHTRAVDVWSKSLGSNHSYVARGLDSLAEVVASRGQRTRARTLYERALRIRRSRAGDGPDVAWTLTNLARTIADQGNRSLALGHVEQAIRIYRERGVADDPDHLARALELRGTIQLRLGRLSQARESLAAALAERERVYGREHPLAAQSRALLARADFVAGMLDAALAGALDAERAGRDHLRHTVRFLPERQALAYAAKRPQALDLALSIAASTTAPVPAAVFDAVILSRGVILDELAGRVRAVNPSDARIAELMTTASEVRQRYANLVVRSMNESVPRALIEEVRVRKEVAEEALAQGSLETRAERARVRSGFEDVRRSLPPDAALVSFVTFDRIFATSTAGTSGWPRTERSYAAFVQRVLDGRVLFVRLGAAASIDSAIRIWREEASGRSIVAGAPLRQVESAYRASARRLREMVWDPLSAHLAGAARVFVVPDGQLSVVSIAALINRDGKYLAESGPTIHYLSAERDLAGGDPISSRHGLLAVGGAAFGMAPKAARSTTMIAGGDCGGLGGSQFPALSGTSREIAEIQRMWPTEEKDSLSILSGTNATETAFKRTATGRRIVHLATHGFFLGEECRPVAAQTRGVGGLVGASTASRGLPRNPLLLSGLAFAGANRRRLARADQDDGILTAEEVASLNLQGTEWAVLSACDTGLGAITAGEGVFGLRRAFQIAGVRTVIMSLWSVDDQATRLWMRALYDGRLNRHLNTADAVREASLTVLRDRRARGQSTHPFFWAAFVAAGDWR